MDETYLALINSMVDTDQAPPRADGYVAMKRRNQGDIITPEIGGNVYFFRTSANIAMAWIAPENIGQILKVRCGCCGNRNLCFTYANVSDVRRHSAGGGR